MKRLLAGLALGFALNSNCLAKQFTPQSALPTGETISIKELRMRPAAAKELRVSLKRFDSGEFRDSARHLEKAIRMDDQVPAAHHNLGVCYLRLREYAKAADEFQRASDLDPRLIAPRISLAGAFFVLGRYPDAERAAGEAYQLDPANPAARYWLSRILATEGHDTPEVQEMLRASRVHFPAAHLVLASLLLKQKATKEALFELQEYLGRPDAPEKSKVACMIERLNDSGQASTCVMN